MVDSKELFDYWHAQVTLKNLDLIADPDHVKTQILRHDCTNYDSLRRRQEVDRLDEPERSRVIAVIKYECTAQVLQRRAGILKDCVTELQQVNTETEKQRLNLMQLIKSLQQQLFGREKKIQELQSRVSTLEVENETLRVEVEREKAHAELLQELETLQKKYQKVEKRKKELAKNNQSLGGRVAHTKRFQRERDEARESVKGLRSQLDAALSQVDALQKQLLERETENQELQSRVSTLEVGSETLRGKVENEKAYAELLQKFETLQKNYQKIEKRKKELAKNNQSLGGRVAHTQRFRRERDEARKLLQELRSQLDKSQHDNRCLQQENASLRSKMGLT